MQGTLFSANIDVQGLENAHSVLLFELLRLLRGLRERAPFAVEFVGECVASMKPTERVEVARLSGVTPIMIDAADISHARRRRLYWCSHAAQTECGPGIGMARLFATALARRARSDQPMEWAAGVVAQTVHSRPVRHLPAIVASEEETSSAFRQRQGQM